jgi:low affinity Fe/Cu permease
MKEQFAKVAHDTAAAAGSPRTFVTALAVCLIWAGLGPHFHYSDTWQLVINTGTSIVTFLIVFLIQHTQNRDSMAIQLKLDELLRAVEGARTGLVDLEKRSDAELAHLKQEFGRLREEEGPVVETTGARGKPSRARRH